MGRRKKSDAPKQFSLLDMNIEETVPKKEEPKKQKSIPAEFLSSDYVIRKYTGRTTCGYIHNHKYLVKLSKNSDVGYTVWAIEDITEDDEVNIGLRISNEISWQYFFAECK